jgi:hypothetical protein
MGGISYFSRVRLQSDRRFVERQRLGNLTSPQVLVGASGVQNLGLTTVVELAVSALQSSGFKTLLTDLAS